jgi:hypothetical protein
MKLISLNLFFAILTLSRSNSLISKSTQQTKDISILRMSDMNHLKHNVTNLYEGLLTLKNTTRLLNTTKDENLKKLVNNIDNSINNITAFITNKKLKDLDQTDKPMNLKKKQKDIANMLNFYNSLSLIMLSLLAGGLVGIIFILFFSFRCEDKQDY